MKRYTPRQARYTHTIRFRTHYTNQQTSRREAIVFYARGYETSAIHTAAAAARVYKFFTTCLRASLIETS